MFSQRRLWTSSSLARCLFIACGLTLLVSSLVIFRYPPESLQRIVPTYTPSGHEPESKTSDYDNIASNANASASHPIDDLIADARRVQESLLHRQSRDVATAAARYREKRGRHPPPGFDRWMEYALKHNAVVVEEFFDRIYHDVTPFWALDPKTTAIRAASWHHVVRVRNGKAEGVGNTEGRVPWLHLWTELVKEVAQWLPDVDMPINYMDESRLLVPWEDINSYVAKEQQARTVVPPLNVVSKFTGLGAVDAARQGDGGKPYDPVWVTSGSPNYWDLARVTCSPDSPGRNVPALDDFSLPPAFPYDWKPAYSYEGYVKNFTASADPCTQPHLRAMHGTFVEPVSMSSASELIPLFGGCKLPMNNEIIIPGAMYITDDVMYSGGTYHGPPWSQKKDGIVWRGAGSGGRHKEENWMHFQRQRLIEALNGTTISNVERNGARSLMYEMAPLQRYDYPRRREGKVGKFLSEFANAGFTDLLCFPRENCSYLDKHFGIAPIVEMKEQYAYKFIPDADGNSFSARYRGLLLSTSLPLKATIYAEWHDDRLRPWLHFVPLDNTFQDIHAVLDYFTRDTKGDAAAKMIAETGKIWTEKVHRREDMLLYTWRVLLEFARVCDVNRDRLGYVEDLAGA